MFESLRQNDRPNGMKHFASLLVSLIVHTAVLSVLVIVPLICFNALHADELLTFLMAPPATPLPPPAPTPPPVASAGAAAKPKIITVPFDPVPRFIPNGLPRADNEPVIIGMKELIEGIGTQGQGTANGVGIRDLLVLKTPVVARPVLPIVKKPVPVRVGSIQESKLIYRPDPVYPPLAIAAHVSGTVLIEAVIDEDGNVTNLKVLKGHPLLNEAAIQAVNQWKYSPTIQNGEPVQVMATVSVTFRIR